MKNKMKTQTRNQTTGRFGLAGLVGAGMLACSSLVSREAYGQNNWTSAGIMANKDNVGAVYMNAFSANMHQDELRRKIESSRNSSENESECLKRLSQELDVLQVNDSYIDRDGNGQINNLEESKGNCAAIPYNADFYLAARLVNPLKTPVSLRITLSKLEFTGETVGKTGKKAKPILIEDKELGLLNPDSNLFVGAKFSADKLKAYGPGNYLIKVYKNNTWVGTRIFVRK